MSYILEALKKAEAQRGRGDVPGLDAQHMPAEPLALQPQAGGHGLLIGIIMVLGLAVIGLLLWSGQDAATGTAPPPTAAPAMAQATPPAAPSATTLSAPTPSAQATPPTTRPETTAPPPVLVPPPDTRDLPRHFQDAPQVASPERPRAAPAQHTAQRTADTPLPEELKAQFPRLSFGGAMHSDNAASRMLIVNGQLLREGDTVAPVLVLQRFELKSSTFRYKGHTHTVQY